MGTVENYLKSIEGPDRAALERVYSVARLTVPQAEEGTSYAMAALRRIVEARRDEIDSKAH